MMLVSHALRRPLAANCSVLASKHAKSMLPKATAAALSTIVPGRNGEVFKQSATSPFINPVQLIKTKNFSVAPSSAAKMSDKEVNELFLLWNNALKTLDPEAVAKRYAKDSILLPTVSDTPRTDYDSIKAYFVDFLKKKPQGVLLESKVIKGDDWALDAGIYEFTMGATGDKVKARYTYLYKFEDGDWKISHHHSSVMPEAFL